MLALSSLVMPAAVFAGVREDAVDKVIENYMPGVTGFGRVVVKGVTINDAKKRITIKLNDNAAYIPFTAERFAQFKSDCKKSLGAKFANYSVTVLAKNKNLENSRKYKLILLHH